MKSNISSHQKKHCTHTFTVILFLIAKIWEQPKQLSTDFKQWYVHNTECVCIVTQSCPGSSAPGIFPRKNTEVSCHFLCQRIFPTQGSNSPLPASPACRQILYHWATEASLSTMPILLHSIQQQKGISWYTLYVDESEKPDVEFKKPLAKSYILYGLIHVKFYNKQNQTTVRPKRTTVVWLSGQGCCPETVICKLVGVREIVYSSIQVFDKNFLHPSTYAKLM